MTALAVETEGQAEFLSRRSLDRSITYDWTEFPRIGAHTVRDLVGLGLPGGRFPAGCYWLFIDGRLSRLHAAASARARGGAAGFFGLDDHLPLDWVYGVEMYLTYHDIPLPYRPVDPGSSCGAVLIWTHRVGRGP